MDVLIGNYTETEHPEEKDHVKLEAATNRGN